MIWFGIIFVIMMMFFPSHMVCLLKNPFKVIFYLIKDGLDYVIHKKSLLVKTGFIYAFVGDFGRGKTISAVHYLRMIYQAHNNVRVYCPRRKKWVTQVVHIVSNVELKGIEHEKLVSLEQVVLSTNAIREQDDKNDTLTVTFINIDEAGAELSNRDFMQNINPLVLNSILTCRHWNMAVIWTAQDYMMVDKLMRRVTLKVYECLKVWRFMYTRLYDGREIERAGNTHNIACLGTACWFVTDADYKAYDTYGSVEKLKKDIEDGKMMTVKELEALGVGSSDINMDGVKYSKAYKRRHKKLY